MLRRPVESTQYTSDDFIKLCVRHKIERSNSRSGSCLDNAAAESFFSRLKCEHVYRRSFRTRLAACESIRAWLDRYNHVRRHSYCGFQAPAVFEAQNSAISVNSDQMAIVAV
ncbi:MAG: transposase [Solirubrobacterales bacterium]